MGSTAETGTSTEAAARDRCEKQAETAKPPRSAGGGGAGGGVKGTAQGCSLVEEGPKDPRMSASADGKLRERRGSSQRHSQVRAVKLGTPASR